MTTREASKQNARQRVLSSIRSRLGVSGGEQDRRASVVARLKNKPINTIPEFGKLNGSARLNGFIEKAKTKGTFVHRASNANEIVDVIESLGLGVDLYATQSALDLRLPMTLSLLPPKIQSSCCISTCYSAIAESGTIVITSGEGSSISQIFLSDIHIAILDSETVEANMESVWQRMRTSSFLPRHITLVSGPSSTGDIELQMEQGAHGPRELHVILVSRS